LALHSHNPDYVWRRLKCISLEEVSVADLHLVAQVLAIAGKRTLQQKLGERELLTLLTARLALAPKCRTACDLLIWLTQSTESSGFGNRPEFDAEALRASDIAQLRHTAGLWHSVAPRSVRTRAGWQVVARGDSHRRDAWLDAAGMPPLVRYIVQRGSSTDTLNVLLVPTYQLARGGVDVISVGPASSSSLETIGGVPAYSYCLYSGPGRNALRHFLGAHNSWRARLQGAGAADPFRALGHLVFHVEGDYCVRPVSVPRAPEIKALSETATLARCGVPAPAIQALEDEVAHALPALNVSRRSIAGHGGAADEAN
jgi:hypothetical protein